MSKILLIEDEVSLLESLVIILEASGLDTLTASNGRNGLDLLRKNVDSIDLILCDINLPDINGYDILKEVKADNLLYKIPFIFLTAYADEKDIRIGMNMGADDYMTKPFSAKELINTINARISVNVSHTKLKQEELNKKWMTILNASFKQEFFTPINGILNASIMLGNAESNFSAAAFSSTVQAIYSSSFRMYRNARNMVLFSLITTHQTTSDETSCHSRSAKSILKEVISWFQNGLFQNKLDIATSGADAPLNVVDNELLGVLFTELIDNALKFNSSATSSPKVTLSAIESGFHFSVSNAIASSLSFNLTHAQPFTKFHKDETHNGLGLGLFLCVSIADKLGLVLQMSQQEQNVRFDLFTKY